VRGLTLDDLRKHPPVAPISEDNFEVGDLGATLARTDEDIFLLVFQITAIRKGRSTQPAISMDELTEQDSEYRVEGEALHLVQGTPDLWAWLPHQFLKVSKPKKGPACRKSGTRDFTLTIQGPLCYRVDPDISPMSRAIPQQALIPGTHGRGRSTIIISETLPNIFGRSLCLRMYIRTSSLIKSRLYPMFGTCMSSHTRVYLVNSYTSRELPMLTRTIPSGTKSFTVDAITLTLPNTADPNTKQQCPLCGKEMKLKQLRGHIGRHILFHSWGMNEQLPREVRVLVAQRNLRCSVVHQVCNDPCGFCGASGCTTRLVV